MSIYLINIILFYISLVLIIYTYFGYHLILMIFNKLIKNNYPIKKSHTLEPNVTIIIAAHNEMDVIGNRIKNLLSLSYPREKIEIIIGSDGSNDKTVHEARMFEDKGVKVLDFPKNRGKALTYNDLIKLANNDIIVSTDADSKFDKNFIEHIIAPFANPNIGCVVGNLIFRFNKEKEISSSEKTFHNNWDIKLKEYESNLGILANGTGAAMAIRKNLFIPLMPVDDMDTRTVIDICLKNYKVIFSKYAIAYDIPPHTYRNILKARIRGTSKTIKSIMHGNSIRTWFKHPLIIWSILSHRILRYLTPCFLLALFFSNIYLLDGGFVYQAIFTFQVIFYIAALIGYLGKYAGKPIKYFSSASIFVVTMIGIFIGVIKVITGNIPVTHKLED